MKYKYVNMQDNIAEVLAKYPEAAEVFLAYGLHCVGCFANAFDTVEAGVQIHGMLDEEITEMMQEVNYVVEQTRSEDISSDNNKNDKN